MKIKLSKLSSIPKVFEPITFIDGINLVMGEKSDNEGAKKGKKTNGVGKSLCVEFINFCLLKSVSSSRVLKIPKEKLPPDTEIILDLSINGIDYKISRTTGNPEVPKINTKTQEIVFANIEDANEYLKEKLFAGMPNSSELGFREFLGPFLREEESEFKDIISCYDLLKRIPPNVKPHAFLFGLDISIINEIELIFKDIDKANNLKKEAKNQLITKNSLKIGEVKSTLNSLNSDLAKIESTIENFKTNVAFDSMQDDLVKIQSEIDELRSKQGTLKYGLKKIKSLPAIENINKNEIEIIYNQYKQGLGNIVVKSIEEVIGFKEKIDQFQNRLFNEKILSLQSELNLTTEKLIILENTRLSKLKIIDQKGILKDVKNGFTIFYEKKDLVSEIKNRFDLYMENENKCKELKLKKSENLNKIDQLILKSKSIIEDFNQTILNIHEFIMDSNEASFDIRSIDEKKVLVFDMRIDDDGSHSIDRTKVFIYDIALLLNKFTKNNHPKLLIHDNIFDADQDTLIKSLNYLSLNENSDFQYILTLNRDKIENEERSKLLKLDILDHRIANFTKDKRFLLGEKYAEV